MHATVNVTGLEGRLHPLVVELSPAPNAWETARRLAHLPHLLFLDSAGGPGGLAHFSYVMADPFRWIRANGRRVEVWTANEKKVEVEEADPFEVLARHLDGVADLWHTEIAPPFQGGAAGLFGYELSHHLERLPRPWFDEFHVPDMAIGLYDWVVAFDQLQKRAWVFSTGLPFAGRRRLNHAERRLHAVLRLLNNEPCYTAKSSAPVESLILPHSQLSRQHPISGQRDVFSNFDRETYLDTVRRAIEYIHAGDCFQVNIAQRLLHPATLPPLELYGRLRARNPAPFAGYFDLGDFVIASASPERFLRVESNGEVEARPIKGTRPRGATPAEDQIQIDELLASAKDRSENVMIVDLLRNDLGRVCEYGTVRVPAVCRLETYRFVHHLVSEVRGRLGPGLGPIDLLRAAFPGGSVTGAPKIRAMEIIAELEPTSRGPYCGSLGYIGFDGSMDTSILIRTFTIGKGWVQFPVGGGIVADSVPEREYEETWHKAEGLLRALRP